MSIKADCHLHSSFSGDSKAPMPEMIDKGISLGLETMCFTEHNDFDYPNTEEGPGSIFLLNTDSYLYDILRCRAKYEGKMRVLFGVELGLQPHLADQDEDFTYAYDFDFVIGSTHLCRGMDPYYPEYFEKFSSEEEAIRAYFAETLENLKCHDDYDVLGHLDYIVRVAPNKDKNYSYDKYKDAIDPILELLVHSGKGLELNTGSFRYGLRQPHPCTDILRRYHELGGEIITVGTDAHKTQDVGSYLDLASEILQLCGFKYYTIYEKRSPEYHKL